LKPLSPDHVAALAAILKERVGLNVRSDGLAALRIAMLARLEEPLPPAEDPDAYLEELRSPEGDEELRRLLPLVTVGKTSFFRDERQFGALASILPGLIERARSSGRRATVWSAGCATGEEPYSIAITAAEAGAGPEELEILATDVNPEAVAFAARGVYESRRVREVKEPFLSRYFDREGEKLVVRAGLRRLIAATRPHNLVSAIYPRPAAGGGFDVVFCRNVIIYFDTCTTQRVLTQFREVLAPGGYLFLGYSESLFRLFEGFELTEVAGAFVYRRPEAPARPPGPMRPPSRPHLVPMPAAPPRVRHLKFEPPEPSRTPVPLPPEVYANSGEGEPPLAPQEYLDAAVALFADGRFGAARELLERLLERGGEDLAVRLTLANLYGILRQKDQAHRCYLSALALEPLSAEAHLFFGIHLFSSGEAGEAARELSRALFLDPDLSLGHYYLGRCREAQRDLERARLAYRNALEAFRRCPGGKRQEFLGYYPDIPEDGSAFARAAEYALLAL